MNATLPQQAATKSNVIPLSRGRELITERQLIEMAKISLFLAMINPAREGETVKDRVERTKLVLLTQFTETGYDLVEADQLLRIAHSEAYTEFLKS